MNYSVETNWNVPNDVYWWDIQNKLIIISRVFDVKIESIFIKWTEGGLK